MQRLLPPVLAAGCLIALSATASRGPSSAAADVNVPVEKLASSEPRIRDTDMAKEMFAFRTPAVHEDDHH